MTHIRLESAKVILDSISEHGDRLTTMELKIWRPMLAEVNTHRSHSRNSASSRAIPVEKQIARVEATPAFPIFWASEQPGMQGGGELTEADLRDAKDLYEDVWWSTVSIIKTYLESHPDKSTRLHKSLINRLLEPFMWHTIIASATGPGWENFFKLRSTAFTTLAQPEFSTVADLAYRAYNESLPKVLKVGEWHTPYITDEDDFSSFEHPVEARKAVSVARCARVSYLTHDGIRDLTEDLAMYARLVTANPPHDSPLEHVATPAEGECTLGNFDGWSQLRHLVVRV
jgi:hypothetical protein